MRRGHQFHVHRKLHLGILMKFVKANALGFYVFFIFLSLDVMAAEQFIPELTRSNAPYDLDAVRDIAKNIDRESMKLGLPEPTNAMTFTNFGMKDIYYALYEEPLIRLFSMNGNKYINGWTLQMRADIAWEAKLGDRFNMQQMEPRYEYATGDEGVGCILKHPFRYTDLDKDEQPELFVLFGAGGPSSLAIFSTKFKKVIFSSLLEYNNGRLPDDVDKKIYDLSDAKDPGVPQYISSLGDRYNSLDVGYRSFGKLFFGDVNDDGKQDIILWRKYFESLLNGDVKKGFAKKDELFVHYSLVNGDYKKQPTDAETIKGWLAAKQLTWQQGFPSRSECPGQEGQLIPELHDPLLNDPDVLH